VVALSLNKAFSAAGGVLALPNQSLVTRIRRCGGAMLFSGPLQSPMLGAAVGSARLHVSAKLPVLQAELRARLALAAEEASRTALGLDETSLSPIFQGPCDSPRVAFRLSELLRERGFYACVCVFPAIPMNRPGLGFTVTRHNELADIPDFVAALDACRDRAKRTVLHEQAASVGETA
jgi:7-keto-8-aminopelargonate synthetase-like enzyme